MEGTCKHTESPIPLLIDTDCGVDDAVALAMALCSRSACDVRAITCVDGNAPLESLSSSQFKNNNFAVVESMNAA